jgi:4-amino-4-deoxy-L-arabinose transferase-like glycosyltransferase
MSGSSPVRPTLEARSESAFSPRASIGLGVAAVVGVYLATRLAFIARFPYFFDEGTYAGFASQGSRSLHQLFVSLTIGREPLEIWLSILWIKLGVNPLVAGRLVSLTAGLVTVGVVGLIGRRLGGGTVGWVSAGLCVLVPFFVVHDGIGIYEPLVTLIMAAALLVQIELARRPRLALGVALGVILAAGVLTKRNTLPALALLPVSLLVFDWSAEGRRARIVKWLASLAVVVALVVVAQLILRSSNYWSQYEAFSRVGSHGVGFAGVRPLSQVLKDPFEFTGQAWSAYRPAFLDYVTIPLLVAALLGVVLGWRSERRLTALLVAWIVVPFGVALTFGTLSFPRHVMYVVPPILVFGALTLVRAAEVVVRAVPGWPGKLACGLGIAVILGPALVADARVLAHPDTAHYAGPDDVQYVTGTQAGRPWPDVRDLIRRRATGQRVDIVLYRSYPDVLRWLLPNDSRYRFLQTSSPLARDAQFLVRDESNFVFPNDPGEAVIRQGGFSLIGRFPRPRGGAAVRLYERAGQQGS